MRDRGTSVCWPLSTCAPRPTPCDRLTTALPPPPPPQDMFVDCDLAQETAAQVKGLRQWVTSEYMHCGLREAGGTIFEKLLNMARGGILLR